MLKTSSTSVQNLDFRAMMSAVADHVQEISGMDRRQVVRQCASGMRAELDRIDRIRKKGGRKEKN